MGRNSSISVIIPVYNAEKYVAEAVASIRRQRVEPLEIIIVNDGSTDGSLNIIEGLGDDIIILNQANAGPAVARNRGMAQASGEFIAFLDADDLWSDDKLFHQLTYLLAHRDIEVVAGREKYFGGDGKWAKKLPLAEDQTAVGFKLGATLIRRSAFERIGNFDETLTISDDYEWFMRARDMGLPMRVQDEIVLYYRVNSDGLTKTADIKDFMLPLMLKKSLDRRREAKLNEPLPKMSGMRDSE